MLLGVDVGGTHTDAVVLEFNKVVAKAKVPTNPQNLLLSINCALEQVLEQIPVSQIRRINLSTTLSTNALVEGRTEEVAVIVSPGPGIDADSFRVGDHYFPVAGYIDHRGKEVAMLNESEIKAIATLCHKANLRCAAVVSKFSTRNPDHEQHMGRILAPVMDHVSMGHRLSGHLNFPRRIATAYFNAAVWRLFNNFANAVEQSVYKNGIKAPINILKADGGTIPLEVARNLPVESILSGPAASVMGTVALCTIENDALILDIGGTTTDIAIFAGASPIIEEDGAKFAGHNTLVRAIKSNSIGIGGDSLLSVQNGNVVVGPERLGPCMALGGDYPTLMDAFNFVGAGKHGNTHASQAGINALATKHKLPPTELALNAIIFASAEIKLAVDQMLKEVNTKPVYTIRELLHRQEINPQQIFIMGGPAEIFKPYLSQTFQQDVILPPQHAVANAIGAALARNTAELELFADTQQGRLLIPSFGVERKVERDYTLENAKHDAIAALQGYLAALDIEDAQIDIIEANSFNMVGEHGLAGRNIRVKCQVRPGLQGESQCYA